MTIFDDFRTLASELMTGDFKVDAQLVRVNGDYNPRTRSRSTNEVKTACHAVLAPRRTDAGNGIVVNQLVATIDQKPASGDRLEVGISTYTVGVVEEIAPDGIPVLWKAVLS